MSGLWLRSQLNAGQDGFRDGNSKQPVDQQRPLGLPECFAPWIDRSHHLLVLQGSASGHRDNMNILLIAAS